MSGNGPTQDYCGKCGTAHNGENAFCKGCGNGLAADAPPAPPAPPVRSQEPLVRHAQPSGQGQPQPQAGTKLPEILTMGGLIRPTDGVNHAENLQAGFATAPVLQVKKPSPTRIHVLIVRGRCHGVCTDHASAAKPA